METKVLSKKYVDENYVHKDKLRKKQYELTNLLTNGDNWGELTRHSINCAIKIIDELLEESEDK